MSGLRRPLHVLSEDHVIDACGFESYTFACKECGAALSGIVDPFDDALLITEMAA